MSGVYSSLCLKIHQDRRSTCSSLSANKKNIAARDNFAMLYYWLFPINVISFRYSLTETEAAINKSIEHQKNKCCLSVGSEEEKRKSD
jgi:hypothetical protein